MAPSRQMVAPQSGEVRADRPDWSREVPGLGVRRHFSSGWSGGGAGDIPHFMPDLPLRARSVANSLSAARGVRLPPEPRFAILSGGRSPALATPVGSIDRAESTARRAVDLESSIARAGILAMERRPTPPTVRRVPDGRE